MPIDGFELQKDGPQSGLLWMTFSNIHIHGKRNTAEWHNSNLEKAKMVTRTIMTELRIGTKHYSKDGKLLKGLEEILMSYKTFGGFFVAWPAERRWKLEGLIKNEGILTHDDSAPRKN